MDDNEYEIFILTMSYQIFLAHLILCRKGRSFYLNTRMKAFQACLRGTIVVRSAGRPTLVPGFLMTRALYFATSSDVGKTGT